MRIVLHTALGLAVSLLIAGSLWAAEEKQCPAGKHPHPPMPMLEHLDKALKGLNLTEDQKSQWEAVKKEYGPKFKEEWQKMESVLTPEQKKARQEAFKAAKAAGEKARDTRKGVHAAMNLTTEQKAKMDEAQKELEGLRKEVHEKTTAILTPEQKELFAKTMREHRKNHKPEGKQHPAE